MTSDLISQICRDDGWGKAPASNPMGCDVKGAARSKLKIQPVSHLTTRFHTSPIQLNSSLFEKRTTIQGVVGKTQQAASQHVFMVEVGRLLWCSMFWMTQYGQCVLGFFFCMFNYAVTIGSTLHLWNTRTVIQITKQRHWYYYGVRSPLQTSSCLPLRTLL